MYYNESTRQRAADINRGLIVETSVLDNATYLLTGGTQTELFNVYGRVLLLQFYLEAITDFSAHATIIQFNATFTTPAVLVQALSGEAVAVTSLAQGLRVVWIGGAVASLPVITSTAGISDVICVSPHIIGMADGVGSIGIVTTIASQASGTFQGALLYVPMSLGAYIEAAL